MMWRAFLLAAAVMLTAAAALAAAAEDFLKANQAYTGGQYDAAIAQYQKLLHEHGYSAAVLLNLGNAYYKTGQVGEAVLAYERALRLDPRNPDVRANLRRVRSESGLALPEHRWWQNVLNSLSPNSWAWVASGFLGAFTALTLFRWYSAGTRNRRLSLRFAQAILFLGMFLSVACAGLATQHRTSAVVVAKNAPVLQYQMAGANSIDSLPEGRLVDVDKLDNQFVRVRYDRDKMGWVSTQDVAPIDPSLF
jgi:tetratricopeptide (TPR) repeat protein